MPIADAAAAAAFAVHVLATAVRVLLPPRRQPLMMTTNDDEEEDDFFSSPLRATLRFREAWRLLTYIALLVSANGVELLLTLPAGD